LRNYDGVDDMKIVCTVYRAAQLVSRISRSGR
jgi:hypothetical protein